MAFTKAKRKKMEDMILKTFSLLDTSGANTDKHKKFFKSLDDKAFTKWADNFFKDKEQNFFLEVMPYENEPHMDDIKKAAKFLDVPLDETVKLNYLDGEVYTKDPVPVG